MLKKLAIESALATALIFFVMWLFTLIPLNISALHPLENAIEEFDMMDLYYAKLNSNEGLFSKNVVLVNIADANREEIASMIEFIGYGNPAAIGVDVYFGSAKDAKVDSALAFILKNTPNTVLGAKYVAEQKVLLESFELFKGSAVGFTNFIGDDASSTIRSFFPVLPAVNGSFQSFAFELASRFDINAAIDFQSQIDTNEAVVNYIGNYKSFIHFEKAEIVKGLVDPEIFDGKVVILGFMGSTFEDQLSVEDKLYTPLNNKISGRALPDMYGAIIHANIVEMIITRNWITQTGNTFSVLFTLILTYIHVLFYMFLIIKWDLYFDALAKVLQIISTLLLLFAVYFIYHNFHIKMHVLGGLAGIAFAVDVLFVYEALANSVYKKFKKKSILIEE